MSPDKQTGMPPAVNRISYDRAAQESHVQSDLVGSPGDRGDLQVGVVWKFFQAAVFADGCAAFSWWHQGHFLARPNISPNVGLHPPCRGRWVPIDERQV